MFKSKKVRLVTAGAVVASMAGGGYAIAQSNAQPANKVMAAGAKQTVVAPGSNVVLMSGTMKTSKPTDLMLQVAAECTILTGLTTNNANPTSNAQSRVRVWVEVDDKIVSLNQVSSPPQDPEDPNTNNGNDSDKVTFCDREYQRSVTDSENPLDGQDTESDYIRTKSAHGFNWVQMNVGSGVHKIEVVADLETATTGNAQAEAIVGNRSLIVEPTKMANNAVIGPVGSG